MKRKFEQRVDSTCQDLPREYRTLTHARNASNSAPVSRAIAASDSPSPKRVNHSMLVEVTARSRHQLATAASNAPLFSRSSLASCAKHNAESSEGGTLQRCGQEAYELANALEANQTPTCSKQRAAALPFCSAA